MKNQPLMDLMGVTSKGYISFGDLNFNLAYFARLSKTISQGVTALENPFPNESVPNVVWDDMLRVLSQDVLTLGKVCHTVITMSSGKGSTMDLLSVGMALKGFKGSPLPDHYLKQGLSTRYAASSIYNVIKKTITGMDADFLADAGMLIAPLFSSDVSFQPDPSFVSNFLKTRFEKGKETSEWKESMNQFAKDFKYKTAELLDQAGDSIDSVGDSLAKPERLVSDLVSKLEKGI